MLKDFKYKGSIQDVFVSPSLTKAFISTTAVENEKVYLYTLRVSVRNAVLTPVADYPLKMAAVQAAFGQEEQAVYFTDSSAADLFFESPFSFSGAYGQKFSVYPRFPFPVFGYNFSSDRLLEIKNSQVLRLLSIPDLQRYLLVADAYNRDAEVSQLIQRGQKLDITSSTYVKIVFPASPSHFIIFFSDSKNAFQALLYEGASNKTVRLDETMFLGENRYAELQIIHFDPAKKEILFLTKDKERELIFFNYSSLLYRKLGSGVLGVFLDEAKERVLALSERNRLPYYSETNLEVVALNPYAKQKINSRHDLIDVFAGPGNDSFLFATYNGEIVSMNEEYSLKSVGLSFADVPHAESPDGKTVAAFINGRLFVLNRDL